MTSYKSFVKNYLSGNLNCDINKCIENSNNVLNNHELTLKTP